MHTIEPFYRWLDLYNSEEDSRSPFFERFHSEFEFTHQIYNYLIHPQWDDIGSPTLFLRVIYCDYTQGYAIIELIGEWNDAINNDIMLLKRDVADLMIEEGIKHYILIGENVLNFHYSDDSYYEEWFEDLNAIDGWIALLNFRPHIMDEMKKCNIDQYVLTGGEFDDFDWRTLLPKHLFRKVEAVYKKRLE
ncbi:MAG TPA: hypothetical protein VK177_08140 [Flavobacteriales bacterium]|nr:hypothetical protein [Flavobacteriales bacterium]